MNASMVDLFIGRATCRRHTARMGVKSVREKETLDMNERRGSSFTFSQSSKFRYEFYGIISRAVFELKNISTQIRSKS